MSEDIVDFSGSSTSPTTVAVAPSSFSPPTPPAAPRTIGPSFRQDVPRPPLRTLLLVTWRRGAFIWQRERGRVHAAQRALRWRMRRRAARIVAAVLARLDMWIWQPALWPFRPAQREMLARTLAALSLALVAAGWIAAYNALAPEEPARPPAPPPPKPFTARIVPHALPVAHAPVDVPKAEAPKTGARDGMTPGATSGMAPDMPRNLAPAAKPTAGGGAVARPGQARRQTCRRQEQEEDRQGRQKDHVETAPAPAQSAPRAMISSLSVYNAAPGARDRETSLCDIWLCDI